MLKKVEISTDTALSRGATLGSVQSSGCWAVAVHSAALAALVQCSSCGVVAKHLARPCAVHIRTPAQPHVVTRHVSLRTARHVQAQRETRVTTQHLRSCLCQNKFVTLRVSMCVAPLRPLAALNTYVFFCAYFSVFFPVYSSVFAGTTVVETYGVEMALRPSPQGGILV